MTQKYHGVVITKNEYGKYSVHRVEIEDGRIVDMFAVERGEDRAKAQAFKEVEMAMVKLSQEITRGDVSFGEDE